VQNAAKVAVVPEHDGALHITVDGCCRQAPPPLQRPVLPQAPFAAHLPWRSAVLAPTLAQLPRLAARLHAWQVPQPLLPQQTPSMQKPLPHSWPAKQATPFPLTGRQLPLVPVQ